MSIRTARRCRKIIVPRSLGVNVNISFIRIYFPPVEEAAKNVSDSGLEAAKEEVAEAEKIASKLPDVPKSDPGDNEHLDKKLKK